MCQSTLIFAVYDFTSAAAWKGALQLKAMFAQLERWDTAVFMTSPASRYIPQAQTLANQLQLPFKLRTIESIDPHLSLNLPLKKHGDTAVLILDSNGYVREKTTAQMPSHAVQPDHLPAQIQRINRQSSSKIFYPQNGRMFPSHLLTPA